MAKSAYKRGSADITQHTGTYDGFMAVSKWGALFIAVGVLFFSAWLASPLSFFSAGFVSFVLLVAGGWWLLNDKGH